MDYLKIISNKGGTLIKDTDDPFDDLEVKCENNHTFYVPFNDIIAGKWCTQCKKITPQEQEEENNENKIIKTALNQLKLKYERNYTINNQEFNFVVNNNKFSFIIENYQNFDSNKFKIAQKNNYAMIIVKNIDNVKNLDQEIWKAITELKNKEKEIIYIGESIDKNIFKHTCIEIEKLSDNSFIKKSPKPWPDMVKIAIGYTRVSTDYQVKDGASLEAQEGEIAAEAKRNGMFLSRIYIDEGISATNWDKRLAFEKLLLEIEENETLIVTRLDRIGRNAKDLLNIHDNLKERGCFLNMLDLKFDTSTHVGKMMFSVFSAQAELERATISERVKATMQFMKKNNMLRIKPPFGMRMNPDHSKGAEMHIPDEKEQLVIEQIRNYRRKYPNLKITAFARKLNDLNFPPPRNSKIWHHSSLKMIMIRENIPVDNNKKRTTHK